MKMFVCDFCEQTIYNEIKRRTIKLKKKEVKMYDPEVYEFYYGITRKKLDICEDCYENMVEYICKNIEKDSFIK